MSNSESRVDRAAVHMGGALKGVETSTMGVTTSTRSWFDALARLGSNIASVVAGAEALGKTYTWVTGAVSAAKAGHGALAAIFPVEAAASRLAAAGTNRMGAEAGAATIRVVALGTATTATAAQTSAMAMTMPRVASGARAAGASLGLVGSVAGGAALGIGALGAAAAVALPILGAIALAVAGLKAVGSGLGLSNEFQQTNIAFETLLGTAQQATLTLRELDQIAIETPFSTTDLQQGARLLLASRVPAQALGQELKNIGNIASATGGDVARLATVYGQVAGKGKLYAEELQQFVEQGAGELRQQVAQTLGVTTAKLMEMMQNGEVGFSSLQQAITDLAGPTGKWGESMQKQSVTNLGLLSTIKDSISKILRLFSQPIADGPLNAQLRKVAQAAQDAATLIQYAIENGKVGETLEQVLILGAKMGFNGVLDLFGYFKDQILDALEPIARAMALAMRGAFVDAKEALESFDGVSLRFDTKPQEEFLAKSIQNAKQAAAEMAAAGGKADPFASSGDWAKRLDATAPGSADSAGGGSGGGGKDKGPFKDVQDQIEAEHKLAELKKQAARDQMSTAEKIADISKEIAEYAKAEAFFKAEGNAQGGTAAEEKKVELQRELNQLQKQSNKEAEDAAKKAQDKAEHQRKEREQMAGARNDLMGELAILKEQAAGHDKKAKAIQRELDIEKEKQDIIAKTGASEADALRLAKEKAGYEDRIAKRKERNSNRDENQGAHIGGITRRRMMGGSSEGAFADLQKSTSRFDALQQGRFGAGALAPDRSNDPMGKTPGSGVDATSQRMAHLMGQTNTAPLSGRIAAATTNAPPKPPGADKKAQEDPAVGKLDKILSELTRIRTA
ncbi:tape measure protein [Prosthecobacter sp.]